MKKINRRNWFRNFILYLFGAFFEGWEEGSKPKNKK